MWMVRVYLQPKEMVYNALLDLMELQKGEEIASNSSLGELHFKIEMYGFKWALRFTVLGMDWNRCGVTLNVKENNADGEDAGEETGEGTAYLESMIRREYALLDSMLLIGTAEAAYDEET